MAKINHQNGETCVQQYNTRDMVYLFGPKAFGLVPSVSPFVLKLETWLRMVDIPYQTVASRSPSAKTKQFPYVFLNGEEIYDSNIIIQRLSEHFSKPVDEHISAPEKAIALAFLRMLEEHTFQAYVWYRYVHNSPDFWGCFNFKEQGPEVEERYSFVENIIKKNVTDKSWHHGIGRKTPEEIYSLAEADLAAISLFLGDKDFLLGEEPTLVDCVLFGHFVQLFYIPFGFPPKLKAEVEFPNLLSFTNRMKARFYPDWEQKCQSIFTQ